MRTKHQNQILNARKTSGKHAYTDRDMNEDTYKLRRKVINIIYQAKKLIPELPRVEVRISDINGFSGLGWLNTNVIRIDARHTNMSEHKLKKLVYHEIGHSVLGLEHDDNCFIMHQGWKRQDEFTHSRLDARLKEMFVK